MFNLQAEHAEAAMDATSKCHRALESAAKDNSSSAEGFRSMTEAIEFSYYDVQGFIRLLRLALNNCTAWEIKIDWLKRAQSSCIVMYTSIILAFVCKLRCCFSWSVLAATQAGGYRIWKLSYMHVRMGVDRAVHARSITSLMNIFLVQVIYLVYCGVCVRASSLSECFVHKSWCSLWCNLLRFGSPLPPSMLSVIVASVCYYWSKHCIST